MRSPINERRLAHLYVLGKGGDDGGCVVPTCCKNRKGGPATQANLERDRQANREALPGMKATMVRGPLWAKRCGELSELAFFYKAASLGFGVAKPWGDSERYDFILDSGQRLWRVQVKSGCHHHNRRYDLHGRCGNREQSQYTSADIDVLVAYLVPVDVWYVIPVEKINNKWLLFFAYGGARCGHYEQYREAWSLMAPQTSDASFLSTGLSPDPQNGRAPGPDTSIHGSFDPAWCPSFASVLGRYPGFGRSRPD